MTVKQHELKILSSRILVRPDPLPEKVGLIIIPDSAREKHKVSLRISYGTVINVGPGMKTKDGGRWPMSVKAGDRILFNYAEGSYRIKLDVVDADGSIEEDVPHLVIRDSFIECVIDPNEEERAAE